MTGTGTGAAVAPAAPHRSTRRDALILAAIFLAALLPRLYHARSSFMNFADHNTSMYAIFARNYVNRGLVDTRLGQVRNLHDVEPENLRFFAEVRFDGFARSEGRRARALVYFDGLRLED